MHEITDQLLVAGFTKIVKNLANQQKAFFGQLEFKADQNVTDFLNWQHKFSLPPFQFFKYRFQDNA